MTREPVALMRDRLASLCDLTRPPCNASIPLNLGGWDGSTSWGVTGRTRGRRGAAQPGRRGIAVGHAGGPASFARHHRAVRRRRPTVAGMALQRAGTSVCRRSTGRHPAHFPCGTGPLTAVGGTPLRSVALPRSGVTLPELLVVVVLLGLLATIVVAAVGGVARARHRVQQVAAERRSTLAVATLLRRDLGDAVLGDIGLVSAPEVRYRRPLAGFLACHQSDSSLTVLDHDWRAERQAVPGRDSALILAAPDSFWRPAALVAVWTATCGGQSATTFQFDQVPRASRRPSL